MCYLLSAPCHEYCSSWLIIRKLACSSQFCTLTSSKLTFLGLTFLVSGRVVVCMNLPGLSFCDTRPCYSQLSIAPRYWPSFWPCGFSVSQTLNYSLGRVFDFLHLLARPDTHGFSNTLHNFVSWFLFFSIPLFSCYWKPVHFLGLWTSEKSFPCRICNTQQPFQLACICKLFCRPGPRAKRGRVCVIHSLSVDSLQSLTRLEKCSKHFFKEKNKNQGSVIEIK